MYDQYLNVQRNAVQCSSAECSTVKCNAVQWSVNQCSVHKNFAKVKVSQKGCIFFVCLLLSPPFRRTILLPGLLEHQQAVQEDATDKWKMVLQDIYRYNMLF